MRGPESDTFEARTTYDQHGRVFQAFDGAEPNSGLEYTYNTHGYLQSAKEATHSSVITHTYYTVTGMDARGNVAGLNKAGLTVSRAFDAATGLPDRFTAKTAGMATVHDLEFTFDAAGNLTARRDRSRRAGMPTTGGTHKDITESYCYDDLNRLTSVHATATTCTTDAEKTLALTYDALGNIESKRAFRAGTGGSRVADANADVGTYTYGARPHAVIRAGDTGYVYDANGSMISGGGRSIMHTVFNKPSSIVELTAGQDDREVLFHYGPDRDRYRRIDRVARQGTTVSEQTTHYAGTVERIRRADGSVQTRRHLDGEAIVTVTENAVTVEDTERYLFKDHLGSTDLIADRAGAVVQAMSFDAFGLRRSADGFESFAASERAGFDTSTTTRGFTGHEGLDAVRLVHMNGRVYDPLIGRFVSADPHIPAPHLTQSYNRYSYAMNNPLSYVDPDGFFFRKLLRVVVTIVVYVLPLSPEVKFAVNTLLQSAIAFLPDLGRVSQAYGQGSPSTVSILRGPAGSQSGRLCIAANCFDAPAEVQATLGGTVSGEYPGMPNGAVTNAYLAALTGSPDSQTGANPSRIGQAWLIENPLATENAVAFIPFGCAATEEGCSTADIVLDTVGLIPVFKPATVLQTAR